MLVDELSSLGGELTIMGGVSTIHLEISGCTVDEIVSLSQTISLSSVMDSDIQFSLILTSLYNGLFAFNNSLYFRESRNPYVGTSRLLIRTGREVLAKLYTHYLQT